VRLEAARLQGAKLDRVLDGPVGGDASRTQRLLGALRAHDQWVRSGGRQGRRAVMDGEDLRELAGELAGLRLTALSAKGACLVGVDLSSAQLQGADLE